MNQEEEARRIYNLNPQYEGMNLEELRARYIRWMRYAKTPPPRDLINYLVEHGGLPDVPNPHPQTAIQTLLDASRLNGYRPTALTEQDLLRAVELMKTQYPYQQEMLKAFYGESEVEKILKGGTHVARRREYNFNPTVREVAFIGDAVIINPEMVQPEDFSSSFRRIMNDKFYLVDYGGSLMDYIKRGARYDFKDWTVTIYNPKSNTKHSFEASKLLFLNDSMVPYTSYKLKHKGNRKFIQIYEGDTLKKLNETNNLNNLVINEGWKIEDRIHMDEQARLKDWQKFIDEYCNYTD